MKKCQDCKESKNESEFSPRKSNGKTYLFSYCKPCMVQRSYKWQAKNKEKFQSYQRVYQKRHKV